MFNVDTQLPSQTKTMTCVFRQVNGLDQYVPITDFVFNLTVGERAFTGPFQTVIERAGPSKSDARTICLVRGQLDCELLTAERIRSFSK